MKHVQNENNQQQSPHISYFFIYTMEQICTKYCMCHIFLPDHPQFVLLKMAKKTNEEIQKCFPAGQVSQFSVAYNLQYFDPEMLSETVSVAII